MRRQPVTGASDQYSLGVVAYEMLAGKPPFTGGGMMAHDVRALHQAPPPIENVRPDCPEPMRAAVMRMLAKEPAERWPSVEDVIAAIGSPTLTPDDPTRSQLIAIAKTGQRWAIGVTTPKSPIPLMRTPLPLSSTPRTGAVATGAGAAAPSRRGRPAGRDSEGRRRICAGCGPGTAAPVGVRRHSAPLSLALAGGGFLIAIAAIAVAIRSRSTGGAAPAQDTGVVPEAAAAAAAPSRRPGAGRTPTVRAGAAGGGAPAGAEGRRAEEVTGRQACAGRERQVSRGGAGIRGGIGAGARPGKYGAFRGVGEPGSGDTDSAIRCGPGCFGCRCPAGAGGAPSAVRTGPTAADRKGVEAAIRGYAAALDGGSAARAQRAFPAMPSAQQTYLESFFGAGGRMRTDWKVADVSVEGDRATARVRGATRTTPGGGNPSLEQVDTRVTLERAADGWTLKSFGGPGGR